MDTSKVLKLKKYSELIYFINLLILLCVILVHVYDFEFNFLQTYLNYVLVQIMMKIK